MKVGDVVFYIDNGILRTGTIRLITDTTIREGLTVEVVFLIGTDGYRYKEDFYTLEQLKSMTETERLKK